METFTAAPGVEVITTDVPIPGFGLIPVNSFVLQGTEPILVDTGTVIESDDYLATLRKVIDPQELRWIWLTHTDFDHIGSLHALLAENPSIRVITTFLGVGIMGLSAPLPMDRLHLLNPNQTITLGDRRLTAWKPPVFDNPSTTGFIDADAGILFSSDCFGALLAEVPQNAADLSDEDLRDGQIFWATVDSPWLHGVDRNMLASKLDAVRAMAPSMICSSHLPPAAGDMTERLCSAVASAPDADPFVGPDQAALEQMLAEMTGGEA